MFGQNIGIDLGTSSALLYLKGKGIVLCEPSVVAMDRDTRRIYDVGSAAQMMIGRTPGNIIAIRPLREGVISDYRTTEKMIKYFLRKVCGNSFFRPNVIICVPSGVTEVEERAVIDAAVQAGAKCAHLIEEPIAAAIGAGIDISKPCGNMVVDIGGGTSDIAVISLGGIVVSQSLKIAGDAFDETIVRFIRKRKSVMIGERTAEQLKISIGCVYPKDTVETATVRGRCLLTGLPKTIEITSDEMLEALKEPAMSIVDGVRAVLEGTPPELIADISENGIVLTGGGSLLYGLDKLLSEETGINAHIAEDAISCVAIGTGKVLDSIEGLAESLINTDKK
ncbi:MAG: rod shape-determining protein MreB [Clostridia bacterium]|nr:rod shape-determining protein MreB [Clostridia bacterium]